MKIKITSLALVLLAVFTTLLPIQAYAATTITATKVDALSLGCPYHMTLSVQDNDLMLSGMSPDYIAGASMKIDLIKPVNYASYSFGSDGKVVVFKGIDNAISKVLSEIGPLNNLPEYALIKDGMNYDDAIKYVNALMKRNPSLDRKSLSYLIYYFYRLDRSLSSTTIKSALLKANSNLNMMLPFEANLGMMLAAAPDVVTVVKTYTHALTRELGSDIAPVITVVSPKGEKSLAYDGAMLPRIDLGSVADGVYNIRLKLSIDGSDGYLYCDDVIILVQDGKACLQVLPTYSRYTVYEGGSCTYSGYSLKNHVYPPAYYFIPKDYIKLK